MNRKIAFLLLFTMGQAFAQGFPRNVPRFEPGDSPVVVGIGPSLPFGRPGGALGHWGVGNGGDWLRIGFARAREYAANIVLRIKPTSLDGIQQPAIREWILKNQKFLAADILQSEHVWELEEKPTCAWTLQPSGADRVPTAYPIQFSYPTCRKNADTFLKAAQILIHESVHHFNGDETTADLVAIGIIDAWQNGKMDLMPLSLQGAPVGTFRHASVWTGTHMVVYGGYSGDTTINNTVFAYDPQNDTWKDLQAPSWLGARYDAQITWTGSEVFIWGGYSALPGGQREWVYNGALYDPASKVWTKVEQPAWWNPRSFLHDLDPRQTLVWTGDQAIVFGGVDDRTVKALAASFDAKTRTWTRINTDKAPLRVAGHSAVWTGSRMIVWGGYTGLNATDRTLTDRGAIYNPADQTWTETFASSTNNSNAGTAQPVPTARAGHQAVWTGQHMVILSGSGVSAPPGIAGTGAHYDPVSNTWMLMRTENFPERQGHKAVWNGEEILIVGGSGRLQSYFGEVYAYNPATQRWRILSTPGNVQPRSNASIIWTGSSAIVWGGMDKGNNVTRTQRSGAMYFP
jgi:N-acetylneuraminic acid mutarotase